MKLALVKDGVLENVIVVADDEVDDFERTAATYLSTYDAVVRIDDKADRPPMGSTYDGREFIPPPPPEPDENQPLYDVIDALNSAVVLLKEGTVEVETVKVILDAARSEAGRLIDAATADVAVARVP